MQRQLKLSNTTSIKSILYDILVAPDEKHASNAYSAFGPLDQRCFGLVTNIYQISISPAVCRVVVAMMDKLHLPVIRDVDICIRLYIE